MPSWARAVIAGAAVCAIAVALYLPALDHEFVWDDLSILMANESLADWSKLGSNLSPGFFHEASGTELEDYWRPLVVFSHMVDRELFGRAARGPHLVNILLHAATSVAVFLLCLAWTGSLRWAFVAGLVFAVHPVHVEVVAWVSGRSDLLFGLFITLALWADAKQGRGGGVWWLTLSMGCFALALLSKEAAVVFPALVAARVLLSPSTRGPTARRSRRKILSVAAALTVLFVFLWIRFVALGAEAPAGMAASVDRWSLFRTWWSGLWFYLGLLVWPATLTILHHLEVVRGLWSPGALAGLLAFLGLAWGCWRGRRRAPAVAFGIVVLLVNLAVLSNFLIPVSSQAGAEFPVAERFLYVPSIGLSLLAGWLLALWIPSRLRRVASAARPRKGETGPSRKRALAWPDLVAGIAAFLLLFTAALRTDARVRDWESDLTLFEAAVRDSPGSYLAHLNYAAARVAQAQTQADPSARTAMLDTARRHYLEAAALAPGNYRIHYDLGNLDRSLGRTAEAAAAYRRSLALNPDLYQARINLGALLGEAGDLEGALDQFEAADRMRPDLATPKVNRAHVLQMLGRPREAIPLYEAALALDPSLFAARDGLGRAQEAAAARATD